MQPQPYTVVVRNASLARIGRLDRLLSLKVVARFNDVDAWEVVIPAGSVQAGLLSRTGGVIVHVGDESGPVLVSGPVTYVETRWSDSDPAAGTVLAGGVSDDVVVADRLAYQVPASAATSQAAAEYDRRSGAAETVIKAYVNANAGPGALLARRVTGLTVETDLARGSSVKGSARMTPMLDLVNPLALSGGGLGWRVVQSGAGREFQVYQPADKTASARFSGELGNLRQYTHRVQAPTTQTAIVGGQGDGIARVFREINDATALTDWGRRVEAFLDRRDTTDTVELDQAGTAATVEGGPQTSLSIATVDIPRLRFAADYTLGDRVTVEAAGQVVVDVLREVTLDWDAQEGPRTSSAVGTAATTGTPRMIAALQRLDAAVAALEAKQ